jgi:hypothetical protein
MLTSLLTLLIVALVLAVIYYVAGMFISGRILALVGVILFVVFLIYTLKTFNIVSL